MAVYTKTGDKGKTGTFNGKRVSKSSKLINTIGAIDELNSYLGIIGGLTEIQRNLFTINAILTGVKLELPKDAAQKLERQIDKWEGTLPVLKNFIIYRERKKAEKIYYARTLCRKAERNIVDLKINQNNSGILIYINRLSDYLFMFARSVNIKKGINETYWVTKKS